MAETSNEKNIAANGHALLIGVQSYRAFDPDGRADLKAGWNDVRALWLFCLRAGFQAENIHVLATPASDYGHVQVLLARESYLVEVRKHAPSLEEREQIDDAFDRSPVVRAAEGQSPPTREAILSALEAMRAHGERHPGAPLFLAFSGHGLRTESGDLALCPTDIDASLAQAIPFAAIREALGGFENATVLLDCCDAPRGEDVAFQSTTSLSNTVSSPKDDALVGFRGRVLCAAGRDERAHQGVFDDAAWRSVLTQSLTNHLWRYRMKREGGLAKGIVTYGELLRDVEADLLKWGQTPRLLSGHPHVGSLRLFQPDSAVHEGPTERTGKVRTGQLVPDFKYLINSISDTGTNIGTIAEVYVCKPTATFPDGVRYTSAQEVWYVTASNLGLLATNKRLVVSNTAIDSATVRLPAGPTKICPANATWDSQGPNTYPSGGVSYYFMAPSAVGTVGLPPEELLGIQLNVSSDKTVLSGVTWLAKQKPTTGIRAGNSTSSSTTTAQWGAAKAEDLASYYRGKSW